MFQTQIAKRAVLCFAFVLMAGEPVGAEPTLLATWTRSQGPSFRNGTSLPPTIPFRFTAILELTPVEPAIGGTWTQDVAPNDIGQTFSAPPEIVDLLDYPFSNDQVRFGGGVGLNNTDIVVPLSGWQMTPANFTQHVPRLADYRLTGLTRTVNSVIIQWVQQNSAYHEGGGQTIRLYGELIPLVPGDFNKEGSVDAADYVVWRDRLATHELMPNGTGQGLFEGRAVQEDYDFWRANYGRSAFQAGAGIGLPSIPEPSTLWLILFGLEFIVLRIPALTVDPYYVRGIPRGIFLPASR